MTHKANETKNRNRNRRSKKGPRGMVLGLSQRLPTPPRVAVSSPVVLASSCSCLFVLMFRVGFQGSETGVDRRASRPIDLFPLPQRQPASQTSSSSQTDQLTALHCTAEE